MKLKTLILSVVVLAALSLAVFIVRRPAPPPSQDSRLGHPIVAAAAVQNAATVRISDQGKTITLVKQPDGTWRNRSYHDLPADFTKLSSFVGSFAEAKLDRLVTTNPERIARLEFKDTKVELLDGTDQPLVSVTFGKTFENGGRFIRYGDEAKAYLANVSAWIDAEPKSWANPELVNVKADDIAKVEIGFIGDASPNPVVVSRARKEDAWQAENAPSGQQVKADKVSTVLSTVTNLRFTDTSDLEDPNATAAKTHQRTLKLTTFDGKTYTVGLGRKPEEKKLKPPAPSTDGKTGPASLGSVSELAKKNEAAAADEKKDEPTALAPDFETIPAGPVFAFVTSSESTAPVNELMKKRAFQVGDYTFTSLPQKPDELFEPAPAAPPPDEKPAEEKKS